MTPADELQQLADLLGKGLLTQAEFDAAKHRILDGTPPAERSEQVAVGKRKKSRRSWVLLVICGIVGVTAYVMLFGPADKEDLVERVKASMQETLAQKSPLVSITVKSVDLVHKGGKQYTGFATLVSMGTEEQVNVEVTVDWDQLVWRIVP